MKIPSYMYLDGLSPEEKNDEGMTNEERRQLRSDLLAQLDEGADLECIPDCSQNPRQTRGEEAIRVALEEWGKNIVEPSRTVTKHRILEYVHISGWTWIKEYANRKLAWCGHFSSFCWSDLVSLETRKKYFPSTYRLRQWAKGSNREIPFDEIEIGDIIIVGDRKPYGDHITIAKQRDVWGWWTVEGNAFGSSVEGARVEGVIRRFRPFTEIRYVYRPLEGD